MHEDLIRRLRELQAITEHCDEQSCDECENRKLCDKHDNKTLSGTYKEAADAIEELTAYVQQLAVMKRQNELLTSTVASLRRKIDKMKSDASWDEDIRRGQVQGMW